MGTHPGAREGGEVGLDEAIWETCAGGQGRKGQQRDREASVPGRTEMLRLLGKPLRWCLAERGNSWRRGGSHASELFWACVCSNSLARGSGSGWICCGENFQIPDLPGSRRGTGRSGSGGCWRLPANKDWPPALPLPVGSHRLGILQPHVSGSLSLLHQKNWEADTEQSGPTEILHFLHPQTKVTGYYQPLPIA